MTCGFGVTVFISSKMTKAELAHNFFISISYTSSFWFSLNWLLKAWFNAFKIAHLSLLYRLKEKNPPILQGAHKEEPGRNNELIWWTPRNKRTLAIVRIFTEFSPAVTEYLTKILTKVVRALSKDLSKSFGGTNASIALIGQQLSFVETKMASDDEDVPGLFIFLFRLLLMHLLNTKVNSNCWCRYLSRTHNTACFILALWQILEPCLRLAKVVSWTTNSGYAMMRLSMSLVETSIPR